MKRGRPKKEIKKQVCKRRFCEKEAKPGKAYCCKEHAPFSSLLIQSNPKQFKYSWIWNKNTSTGGFLNAKRNILSC